MIIKFWYEINMGNEITCDITKKFYLTASILPIWTTKYHPVLLDYI